MENDIKFILKWGDAIDEDSTGILNDLLLSIGAKASIESYTDSKGVTSPVLRIKYDFDVVEQKRTRGAGRKKNNKEFIDKWTQFCELKNQGKSKTEIQEQMKISDATYFRYLKYKREGNL